MYSRLERKLIYENTLSSEDDIKDFKLEGSAEISFSAGRMRMENLLDPGLGQKSNYVLWCTRDFPADIDVEWDFWPIREPGLCMMFFSARGRNNEDIFDSSLSLRDGMYDQYCKGEINTYHVSYFRRRYPEERAFHTCNLRKSYGLHLVCQGGDPIPSVPDAAGPYHLCLHKYSSEISLKINDMVIFKWEDDGITYGPVLQCGKIGFRQMAPMIGEYANLKVYSLIQSV